MSKIGKIPVLIKEGVTVTLENGNIKIAGPKGNLSFEIPVGIKGEVAEGKVVVSQDKKNDILTRALFGLTRSMIANMVTGVSTGFEKKLELSGVGYRAQAAGNTLTLFVGFSHPVVIKDENVSFAVEENVITVSGIRTNKDIFAQTIDDEKNETIVSASEKDLKEKTGTKSERSKKLGIILAEKLKKAKAEKIVFDKGSFRYHGRVKALAEGLREGGIKF